MASDSISEYLFSKIFQGGNAPRPPSISTLHMLIQWNVFIDVLHIHMLCFQEDNTLPPPPRNPLYLILTPLDQNPERKPAS